MSRSFTTRPAVARAPRGRQRQAGQSASSVDQPQEGASSRRPDISERTQRRDAYTVIAPDEEKRRQLQQKAEEEERRLKEYRERNRVQHVSYVGTVGDVDVPADADSSSGTAAPRNRPVNGPRGPSNLPASRLTPQQKSQQYRSQQKQREDAEIEKKKQEQRRKATSNQEREQQRKEKLDEDRKKKMDAFLNRLEASSKHSTVCRQAAAAVAMEASEASSSNTSASAAAPDDVTDQPADHYDQALDQLEAAFPDFSRSALQELLLEAGGDVDDVIEALTG